jgi:hypothetical protein
VSVAGLSQRREYPSASYVQEGKSISRDVDMFWKAISVLKQEFFQLISPGREIPDVLLVLEFLNLLLLAVPSLYSRLTWAFCYVIFFCFRWFLFRVLVVIPVCLCTV